MSIFSFSSDFTVYDGRHHVLGASVIAAMDDGFRTVCGLPADGILKIKRAKFISKTGCNGTIHLSTGAKEPSKDDMIAAILVGSFEGHAVSGWFVPNPDQTVTRDIPSANRITHLVPKDEFGGNCQVEADEIESLLRCVVDANKLLQLKGIGIAQRFGDSTLVTELVYWENIKISPTSVPFKGQMKVHNLAMRYDRNRLFTLNGISLVPYGSQMAMEFRMALSFHERM